MLKSITSILTILLVISFTNAQTQVEVVNSKIVASIITPTIKEIKIDENDLIKSLNETIINTVHNDKNQKDITCLAKNVFYEARNQPIKGKIAVAYVPLTRAHHDDVCKIINKKNTRGCQFTWICVKSKHKSNVIEDKAWREAMIIAYISYNAMVEDPTLGATYYYNPKKAHPAWAKTKKVVVKIGDHIFLKD